MICVQNVDEIRGKVQEPQVRVLTQIDQGTTCSVEAIVVYHRLKDPVEVRMSLVAGKCCSATRFRDVQPQPCLANVGVAG